MSKYLQIVHTRGGPGPGLAVNKNKARARSSPNHQSSVELFLSSNKLFFKFISYNIIVNSHTFVFFSIPPPTGRKWYITLKNSMISKNCINLNPSSLGSISFCQSLELCSGSIRKARAWTELDKFRLDLALVHT